MTNSRRWVIPLTWTVAGLIATVLTFQGVFGLLWGGFPGRDVPWELAGILGPLALTFPLFFLSVFRFRLAPLGLWILVPIHWISTIAISLPDFKGGPLELLRLLASSFCTVTLLGLAIVAGLVQWSAKLTRPEFPQPSYER